MSEAFPWLSLDPDEDVVWSGTPRPHVIAPVVLVALAIVVLAILAVPQWWIAALAGLAGAGMVGAALVYVRNVEFVVSTNYLYAKRGVVGRSVTQIGLQNVQDATLRQGVFGTQFGHGTISFSTAGGDGDQLRMYAIADPTEVKATVDEQVARARSGSSVKPTTERDGTTTDSASEGDARTDQVSTLLSEARALRSVAEQLEDGLATGQSSLGAGPEGRAAGDTATDTSTDGGSVDGGDGL